MEGGSKGEVGARKEDIVVTVKTVDNGPELAVVLIEAQPMPCGIAPPIDRRGTSRPQVLDRH